MKPDATIAAVRHTGGETGGVPKDRPLARPLRIFIVENHRDTLKYLTLYLEQLGHVVRSAGTMAAAQADLQSAEFDVLISDIGLPDGDGWKLLRHARESLHRPIYAIAMSGFGMNSDRQISKDAGYRHHVLKPFDPEELDGMLEEAAAEMALET